MWKKSILYFKDNLIKNSIKTLQQLSKLLNHKDILVDDNAEIEEIQNKICIVEKLFAYKRVRKFLKRTDETLYRHTKDLFKFTEKLTEYDNHFKILGDRNSYSKVDTDATFMRLKEDSMLNGQLKPAYNVQIATSGQFIVDYDIYPNPTDTRTFIPFVDKILNKYYVDSIVADSGYGSEENYVYTEDKGIKAYIKYNTFDIENKRSFKKKVFNSKNFLYDKEKDVYTCPNRKDLELFTVKNKENKYGFAFQEHIYKCKECKGCPDKERCCHSKKDNSYRTITDNKNLNRLRNKARALLETDEGKILMAKRKVEPETAFGNIKYNHKFRRFILKGNQSVKKEFGLVALSHNLRKLSKFSSI